MVIKITYLIHYDYGEYEPDEKVRECRINNWDDLPEELKISDDEWLDVIKIEVVS